MTDLGSQIGANMSPKSDQQATNNLPSHKKAYNNQEKKEDKYNQEIITQYKEWPIYNNKEEEKDDDTKTINYQFQATD